MVAPKKIPYLIKAIHDCIDSGRYLDTRHATDRKNERSIPRPELLFVLRYGFHEKRKDKFEIQYQAWNYSIRGQTVDKRNLRVIVSFDQAGMLIITAIDLDK